jgi:hypothetical protein
MEFVMPTALDHTRALRYRRLALAETDKTVAALLNRLAQEAELGILFTADRHWRLPRPQSETR